VFGFGVVFRVLEGSFGIGMRLTGEELKGKVR